MIYDISLEISENTIVYPNNPGVKIKAVKEMPSSTSNVSEIALGSHTGTHVDAEKHIANNGRGADTLPLASFYGKAKVFDLTKCKYSIGLKDVKNLEIGKGGIILFKTSNSVKGFKEFFEDFVYLSEEAADYIAAKGVKTLGVDYLTVQKFHAGNQIVHNKIIRNMTLFEGLDLSKVPEGEYFFIYLPLKIKGCDGSPARAILLTMDEIHI